MLYDPKWEESDVVRALREARAQIERPENWSSNGWSNNSGGLCVVAAICKAKHGCIEAQEAFQRVVCCYAGTFNDSHTHSEVLAALDKTIAAEQAKQ